MRLVETHVVFPSAYITVAMNFMRATVPRVLRDLVMDRASIIGVHLYYTVLSLG